MSEALLTPEVLNLPYAVAKRYAKPGQYDYDELVSCGFLALWRAARNFDPDAECRNGRPAVFSSYAMLCVLYGTKRYRCDRWVEWDEGRIPLSLHDKVPYKNGSFLEWEEMLGRADTSFAECDVREEAESILGRLSPPDREVLEMRYAGDLTYDEISRDSVCGSRGLSREAVRKRITMALRRARGDRKNKETSA